MLLIAGPCVLCDDAVNLEIAHELAAISERLDIEVVFKGSFDKANRSRLDSPRGPGIEEGLYSLDRVKAHTGLRVSTDIHEVWHASSVARVVDIIQIPAFLCRQTDLIKAAGYTGKVVNIKKGQWMSPEEMEGAVEKAAGASEVMVTERGTAHGYGDLIVDMRSFSRIKKLGVRAIFDGTHSVQRSGPDGSGGDPEHVPALVRAAVAAGCDGLFLEVHPEPSRSPSDATTMLPLADLEPLVREAQEIHGLIRDALAIREALT